MFGQHPDRIIARLVTKRIIDLLELVNINQQETEGMVVSRPALDLAPQMSLEAASIGQASQVVREGRFFTGVEIGFEVQQSSNARKQQVQIGRIGEKAQRPGLGSMRNPWPRFVTGLKDDGNELVEGFRAFASPARKPFTSASDVGYYQIRWKRFDSCECFSTLVAVCTS